MATVPSRVHRAKLKKRIGYKYPQPYQVAVKRAGQVYDRIYAILYGGCIGDALGLLTESLSKEEAKKIYGKVCNKLELVHKKLLQDAHRRKWAVYDWTEETDLMVLTAQSLITNRGKVVPEDLAKRLMEWSEHGFPELADTSGVGLCSFTKSVLAHPQFSEKPQKAAEIVWRNSRCEHSTNCALSRAPLMGVHYYNILGKVIKNSLDVCSVTDADPRCHASCVAVSVAVSAMLQKDPKHLKKTGQYDIESIIEESYSYSMRCLLGLPYQEVKKLKNVLHTTSLKDLNLDEPGKMNDTYKTLGAGFWALKQKDFRSAIQEIIMEGGDADANASLAGAMLGCKLGLQAIPASWVESLMHRLWLDDIIDSYLNLMERGAFKPKCETVV
ncbi:ADP-ribosylarginine hydrolase Tri1-like [Gigantopelta aegis]|uniref:ADP-ribosylarginine hydrolase Tri1-like n=1 Tax=Gigantopelta aegis TaxID=1735272 RepID=UPI001B888119|nr:ADP-ribosylarginine hydrolase Tri1-like [Gigantopelta aegis]